jgi:hypothetical protein
LPTKTDDSKKRYVDCNFVIVMLCLVKEAYTVRAVLENAKTRALLVLRIVCKFHLLCEQTDSLLNEMKNK